MRCNKKANDKENAQLLQGNDCPLNLGRSNKELFDWYYVQNHGRTCACLYEVVSYFFMKDLGKNGVDVSSIFEEPVFQNGNCNQTFGAIPVGAQGEDFVFVARYWGVDTLESLLTALDMWGYVGKGTAEIKKPLEFKIADL